MNCGTFAWRHLNGCVSSADHWTETVTIYWLRLLGFPPAPAARRSARNFESAHLPRDHCYRFANRFEASHGKKSQAAAPAPGDCQPGFLRARRCWRGKAFRHGKVFAFNLHKTALNKAGAAPALSPFARVLRVIAGALPFVRRLGTPNRRAHGDKSFRAREATGAASAGRHALSLRGADARAVRKTT